MGTEVDIDKLIENLNHFPNYWDLYIFVKQIFPKREEFNTHMKTLRPHYLKLLPLVSINH